MLSLTELINAQAKMITYGNNQISIVLKIFEETFLDVVQILWHNFSTH